MDIHDTISYVSQSQYRSNPSYNSQSQRTANNTEYQKFPLIRPQNTRRIHPNTNKTKMTTTSNTLRNEVQRTVFPDFNTQSLASNGLPLAFTNSGSTVTCNSNSEASSFICDNDVVLLTPHVSTIPSTSSDTLHYIINKNSQSVYSQTQISSQIINNESHLLLENNRNLVSPTPSLVRYTFQEDNSDVHNKRIHASMINSPIISSKRNSMMPQSDKANGMYSRRQRQKSCCFIFTF